MSSYVYDPNGNLTAQSYPEIEYTYDSLNRLRTMGKTHFSYDVFGRCLAIKEGNDKKLLFYQGEQEIGSLVDGKMEEFRLVHPEASQETTFAIEIGHKVHFPIQDDRSNIVALQNEDGTLVQYSRFSPFGEEELFGDKTIKNPWRFANRRQVNGLSLFSKRLYSPQLRRWLTSDPLGFEDGLNLYTFVRNNPLRYQDPDGQFAFAIPLFCIAFGEGIAISTTTLSIIGGALAGCAIGWAVHEVDAWSDTRYLHEKEEENKSKDDRKRWPVYAPDRPLPLDEDGKHVPDTDVPHTQLGTRNGEKGKYPQAREFDENGRPVRDIDFTDHGRPDKHPFPHQHRWKENPTGGTRQRNKLAEPVTGWEY